VAAHAAECEADRAATCTNVREVVVMTRPVVVVACALALAPFLAMPGTCAAADEDAIAYRQHVMTTLNEQSAALGQILATAIPDDNVVAHLEVIALSASTALKAFEPRVAGGESKAEVWTHWDDFSTRMQEFAQKTADAVKKAKAGRTDEVLTNISDVLSCKSCHDVYRDEKR